MIDDGPIYNLLMPATYGWHLTREFPAERLLEGTGLSLADIEDSSDQITVRQLLIYVQNTLSLAQRPDWYLGWSARLADHFHGPISIALVSAPTLGAGLDAFLQFFPSGIPYMHMQGRSDSNQFAAELRPLIELGNALLILIETPLMILYQYIVTIWPLPIQSATIELDYTPTPYADRYHEYFNCQVKFAMARNALIIPKAWRSFRNPGYVESAWRQAIHQCEATSTLTEERDALGQVLWHLNETSQKDRSRAAPTLEATAGVLHLSTRTLIRRLRGIGTTYQNVVDEFLRARACELLRNDGMRIKQVADALGFQNPSNFGKVFKRWTGLTPGNYRTRILVGARSQADVIAEGRPMKDVKRSNLQASGRA